MAGKNLSQYQKAIRRAGKDPTRKVLYEIHPGPQTKFMESTAEEVLYGGAYAGGKSLGLRAWGVNYCMAYPGANVVLFRRSYRELEDTHVLTLQQEVPLAVAKYSSGTHTLIFNNGSMLFLRYCEQDADVATYHTSEFDAMLFDELTQFTEYQYTGLVSRCRSTKPWWTGPRIRSAATPLGIGHSWVKARWVDEHEPNEVWKSPLDQGGLTRQFIPARVQDNPTLMKADPHYIDRLRALPYEEYKAKALGDWNVFTGQFFTRWRRDFHVQEPFDIPPDWDRWLLNDYGFNAPFASLWVARPPAAQSIWVYREQYGKGVELDDQVTLAWDITKDSSETLKGVVLDPSLFNKVNVKGERIKPMADHWREKFGGVTNIYRGDNQRVSGWRLFRTLLDWEEAPTGGLLIPPRIFFFSSCPNSIRSIPELVCDKFNLEDVDTKGEDHAADAIRYGIQHIFAGSGRNDLNRGFRLTQKGVVKAR